MSRENILYKIHPVAFESVRLTTAVSKREDHPVGGLFFWSRIRESNPPSRLGKPLYYRYTNPARVREL